MSKTITIEHEVKEWSLVQMKRGFAIRFTTIDNNPFVQYKTFKTFDEAVEYVRKELV